MRTRRWLGLVLPFAWVLALVPVEASADGGAYIDLDRTHFLVGSTGHAETYVSIPASKQDLFDRGPFYLYVTPSRSPLSEGRPLPSAAVRIATVTIEHDRGTAFELSASFTVPDLPGDYYALGVCNDPCTISGFREPLTGSISIVQTTREGQLLNEQQRLVGVKFGLKRQIRKLHYASADLERRLSHAGMQESELNATVTSLRGELADARTEARGDPPWVRLALVLWAVTVLLLVGVIVVRHRRRVPAHDVLVVAKPPEPVARSKERSLR